MDKYNLAKDLWEISQMVQDIHLVEANSYTLLTALREYQHWFTVLFEGCLIFPLNKQTKSIFAFEWESPQTDQKTQLTWTVLSQGFKNSPVILENQVTKELETQK